DRGHHARREALGLERVAERERVDHRREHPHVVGGRALRALLAQLAAAQDVPAADDDRDLHAALRDGHDLARDVLHGFGIDPLAAGGSAEGFAGELQEDALERLRHGLPSRGAYLPIWKRAKASILEPFPSFSSTIACTVFESSFIHFCSGRTWSA